MLFGFCKKNITPQVGCLLYGYVDDLQSESVHDQLSASAFYFEEGKTRAIMISAEVCSIHTKVCDRIRKEVSSLTGVASENIIVHGIHNHTGPNTDGNAGWGELDMGYIENILLPVTLSCAKNASETAVPARAGFNMGKSNVAVNRREQNLDNNIIFGQCEWGSYDPRMAVISFCDEDKKIIASMIFYTCHGTTAGLCREISRDFAGGMLDALETHTGAPAAFFCGAEGDVGPRLSNGQTVGNMRDTEIMGALAGRDAVSVFEGIEKFEDASLKVCSSQIKLPLKKRISPEEALCILDTVRDKTVNLEGQTRDYCERVLLSYEKGFTEEEYRVFSQTVIAIGDYVFIAFPYELFSDVALRINKAHKKEIFSLSNANGSEGYFPCHSEISKGGYEINMFMTKNIQPYCDNADWYLIKETLKNLEGI